METAPTKRIIIVGGGFAGVSAYRTLSKCRDGSFELLLISDTEQFVHIPLIHEVATFGLPSDVVAWPLSKYIACPKNELLHGRVTFVDADKKCVTVESQNGEHTILPFDFLVLATGSVPALPNIPGADTYLMRLRTLSDAEKIRDHILAQFREAQNTTDAKKRDELLTFVCVGAGVTGVELVGELSNLFSNELSEQYAGVCGHIRVVLINNREQITLGGHVWFGQKAQERLAMLPLVQVHHNTEVLKIKRGGILTQTGEIPTRTVIWTGGVAGAHVPVAGQPPVSYDDRERITVMPELHLENQKHVFIVGDVASIPKIDGGTYGMQAQFAVMEGKHAGKNILRLLRGIQPKSFQAQTRGFLMPIGKHYGLAEIFGFKFSGFLAWHIAHIIYVFSVVRWDLKLQVAWKWLYHLMCRRKTV